MATELNYAEIRNQVERGELRKSDVWSAVNAAARKGDIDATFTLAHRYYHLRGKDYEKTRWWLVKASELGHPVAQQLLGEIDAESLNKRKELAAAAEAGDLSAQVNLGHILGDNWDGLGLDLEQSRRWFLQASLQGSQSARYHLGLMFLRGEGGPADVDKGVHWLEKAAFEETYSGAEVLADLYEVGSHVVTDGDEMTVYTAVERPLHEQGARIFAAWASANGVSIIEVRSNLLRLRLGSVVSESQVLEQLGACRSLPLTEGMAEVVDRSGLWDDLPAEAGAFIEIHGENCDAFSHLRVPIRGVPKSQSRWVE